MSASFAHDYHAMSVVRAALGIGFEPVSVTATTFDDRGVQPLGRAGWSEQLQVETSSRTVASLVWQDRSLSAVYDFTGEQYFSPIRSRRMTIRGTHRELAENRVTAIRQPGEPFAMPLVRNATGIDGDLEGFHLRDVRLDETVLWRSSFGTARLSDDELAVATVLRSMATYIADGTRFYGIADAAEDQYLDELIHRAASEGRTVTSAPQAWSSMPSVLD